MTTAIDNITIKYVIKKTDTKVYDADKVHLTISNSLGNKIINNPTVVAQVPNTSDGLVTFSNVPLEVGGNRVKMQLSDINDLDGSPSLTRLGGEYIRYIGVSPTEVEV